MRVLRELVETLGSQRAAAVALEIPDTLLSRYLQGQVNVPNGLESLAHLRLAQAKVAKLPRTSAESQHYIDTGKLSRRRT
jgi:hypothetical protein